MAAEDVPSFEANIKDLFREKDRKNMLFAFDLWSHEDVTGNAEGILERLEDGEMPCDGAWSEEWIERFRAWVEAGCPE